LELGTAKKTVPLKKLENKCEIAYFTKPGLGYTGSKYVYKHKSDLIKRKIIYYKEPFMGICRKMTCIGIDDSQTTDKAIFQDYSLQIKLNDEDLRRLGYSQILPE